MKTFPLVALLLAAPLGAQIAPQGWLGADGFDVGCCNPVSAPNLPAFAPFQLDGLFACIASCELEGQFRVSVSTQHIPLACDLAIIPFQVVPAEPDAPGWTGMLIGKYSRTWVELDPAGTQVQVWRWLVNTDAISTAGQAPHALPPHPPDIVSTHFTGHIDYACSVDPITGALDQRMAINLNHLPGCISHNIFSAVPLLPPPFADGHHDRSYHLAAPDTFSFTPVPAPIGFTAGGALRSAVLPPLPYVCLGPGAALGGALFPGQQSCLCPAIPASGPFLWENQAFSGSMLCQPGLPPVGYAPIPLGAPAPPLPTGFLGFPLGTWTGLDPFPGLRSLTLQFGVLSYADPCNPAAFPVHIVTGLSTLGPPGFAFGDDPGPWPVFLDLQDMILPDGLIGPYTLGFGSFFLSQVVWNLNFF